MRAKIIGFDKGVEKINREAEIERIESAINGDSFTKVKLEVTIGSIEDIISFKQFLHKLRFNFIR